MATVIISATISTPSNGRPLFDYAGTYSVYQVGRQVHGTIQVKY